MKNFKKLLMLTALVSAISGTALGIAPPNPVAPGIINNPGDDVSKLKQTETAVAGVPMEVRVNVIGQGPQLVLVDETGTLIENLTFDHGNKLLVTGTDDAKTTYIPQESKVEKIVIMKRTDGKAFGATDAGVEDNASKKTYKGSFFAKSNHTDDDEMHQMTLVRLGNSSSNVEDKILSELDYRSEEVEVKGTDTELRTTVVSTIPQRTVAKPGLYIGTGMFIGSLTLEEDTTSLP